MNANDQKASLIEVEKHTTRRDFLKSAAYIGGIAALGSLIFSTPTIAGACTDCTGSCMKSCTGACVNSCRAEAGAAF